MYTRALPCPTCGCGNCSTCEGGGGPEEFQVVIAGVANTGGGCGDCVTNWNATFILTKNANEPSGADCCWSSASFTQKCVSTFGGTPNGWSTYVRAVIQSVIGTYSQFDIVTGSLVSPFEICTAGSWNPHNAFRNEYGYGEVPCSTMSSESIAFLSAQNGCDWSGATCNVTAL